MVQNHHLAHIPLADLLAEVEAQCWLLCDLEPGTDSRAVGEIQLEPLVNEIERRRQLWQRAETDPHRPTWPPRSLDLQARVQAVKQALPVQEFVSRVMVCQLEPAGRDRWKGRCPLPGHDDKTPSFLVYTATASAWCFGCQRGGDIFGLARYWYGEERFWDRLKILEEVAGTVRKVAS
jgi:CHC2 zinc finger